MSHQMIAGLALAFGISFLISAVGGYLIGRQWKFKLPTAAGPTGDPFSDALAAITEAGRRCELLAKASWLTERQILDLLERQKSLAAAVSRLAATPAAPALGIAVEPMHWERQPLDPATELPDRSAFDINLRRLVQAIDPGLVGGLLLVSLDKAENLEARIGEAAMQYLRRSVAGLLCRAAREQDLICALAPNLYAILFTPASEAELNKISQQVREAFISHHFRSGEDGNEVLLTASFGYSPGQSGEAAELLLDGAHAALAVSQRRGRNRLHAYHADSGRVELKS